MSLLLSAWLLLNLYVTRCNTEIPCNRDFGVELSDGLVFENGSIEKDGIVYAPDHYRTFDGITIGCVCRIKPCVRKCCPLGQHMMNRTCEVAERPFDIPETKRVAPLDSYHIVFGNECGPKKRRSLLDPQYEEDRFVLEANGELFVPFSDMYSQQKDYCVDFIDDMDELTALTCTFKNGNISKTNLIGMMISMPFLLLTFIVYAILPNRNMHGKSLMCYVITLFAAYLLLVIIQTDPEDLSDANCKAVGILCLFFFMVSFFLMNVMSIDIWWTFSGLRGFSGTRRQSEQKRFLLYSGYAWGVPLLLVILVTSLTVNGSIPFDVWYNPGISDGQCWFREGVPQLVYFYGPVAALIATNIILFGITAWKIKQIQKDTAILRKDDSRKHTYESDKQRFNLYLKLMLAMGVNWSMEIVSWAVDWQVGHVPRAVWLLTDFCNAIYGMFIFFVFVFKRSVWNLLKMRYYMLMGKPHLARTMTQPPNSQSPQSTGSSVNHNEPAVHFVKNSTEIPISQGA